MRIKNFSSFAFLPVDRISTGPSNPRKEFDPDDLHTLSCSIVENGIIQPLCVRKSGNSFVLISGERRLRAAVLAGLKKVPCLISNVDDRTSAMLALMENIQRKPLDCFEEADGILNLMTVWGYSKRDIATGLGMSRSLLNQKLRLLKLSDWQRERIKGAGLTPLHSAALVRIDDEKLRDEVLLTVIAKGLDPAETDRYIDSVLIPKEEPQKPKKKAVIADERLIDNTISHAVDAINLAGFKTDVQKSSEKDWDTFCIKISKLPLSNEEPAQMFLKLCAGE